MLIKLRVWTFKVQHGTGEIEYFNTLSSFETKIIVFKFANGDKKLIDINSAFNTDIIKANGGNIEISSTCIDIDTDELNWNENVYN